MATASGASDGKGMGLMAVVWLVVLSLSAAGAGVGSSLYLIEFAKTELAKQQREEREKTQLPTTFGTDSRLVRLQPIIANLKAPQNAWIRLETSVLLEGPPESGSAAQAVIESDFLTFVRTLSLQDIQGAVGLAGLKEDLEIRAAAKSGGLVREVVVHALVIQ